MAKKNYTTPNIRVSSSEPLTLLQSSKGVTGSNDLNDLGSDISYGGVDEDGSKDPASRSHYEWDDDF